MCIFRYCVTKCPDAYTVFLNRCVPKQLTTTAVGLFTNTGAQSLVEEVVQDLEIAWKEIIYMGLIALGEGSCLQWCPIKMRLFH